MEPVGALAGRWAVISVAMLGAGRDAARYYLAREAGCRADYYLNSTEAVGRRCGAGLTRLGLQPQSQPRLRPLPLRRAT